MDLPPFLDARAASEIQKRFGTPVYVYDQGSLEAQARSVVHSAMD